MRVAIAGFEAEVLTDLASMDERVSIRYGGFLPGRRALAGNLPPSVPARPAPLAAGERAPFVLELTVDPARRPEGVHPEWVDNPPLRATGDLERALVEGDGFEGEIDWRAHRARATIPDSLAHLDMFLRIALAGSLLRAGDTLLHAACVVRDRFGVVFSGKSGAGKSTVAALCREIGLEVLADEMIAFRRAGPSYRFHGTPFWFGEDRSAPCGALVFLEQASEHAVAALPAARALPRLIAAGGAPLALPAVQEAFFAACATAVRRVPSYVLRFRPDAGFWDALDTLPEFSFFRPRPERSPAASEPVPVPLLQRLPPRG